MLVVHRKRRPGRFLDDPLDGGEQQVRDRLPGVAFARQREQVVALGDVAREDGVGRRVHAHPGTRRGAFDLGERLEAPCQGCIRALLAVLIHVVGTGHAHPLRVEG